MPHFFMGNDIHVLLVPMEGVFDSLMRELLTEVNDCGPCITEFTRVVDQSPPTKVFHHICPELQDASRAPSGTLVRVQSLGQFPQWLTENAARTVGLGSRSVDPNCGRPSKTANGSDDGATSLKDPEFIYRGVEAMCEVVSTRLSVSVEVCLGWDSGGKKFEIADAVQQAGTTELVVHGRTKEQGYRAEHIGWQVIGEIRQRLNVPMITNGGIWGWQSMQQCMATSSCDAVMIGREALNVPSLSRVVKCNEPRIP